MTLPGGWHNGGAASVCVCVRARAGCHRKTPPRSRPVGPLEGHHSSRQVFSHSPGCDVCDSLARDVADMISPPGSGKPAGSAPASSLNSRERR
ncbi:hypothetical protein MTO96_004287 [Rhipicephalus appendiculatus]